MPTYVLLSSNVLASNTASVTFSSIPSTYTDLLVRFSSRSDAAYATDSALVLFNNTTGQQGRTTRMFDVGGGTSSSESGPTMYLGLIGNTAAANFYGSSEMYIPNYATTSTRQIFFHSTSEDNATGARYSSYVGNAYWTTTTAISTIKLNPQSGTVFLATSSFYLYGIKSS